MSVLERLAQKATLRVREDQERVSAGEMRKRAEALGPGGGAQFRAALKRPGLSFICEVKRASPSKGLIVPDFKYLDIARCFEEAGADCVSCLTEPTEFLGSDEIFSAIRRVLRTPMLRKDFTVSAYQIDQARVMGADAVLLICALLEEETLRAYLDRCAELGLAALVETHNEREIRAALEAGADIIGVNNRDLKTFTVDLSNAARLRALVSPDRVFVAESGVRGPEDTAALRAAGADAVLIGEALMRAEDKGKKLRELRGEV